MKSEQLLVREAERPRTWRLARAAGGGIGRLVDVNMHSTYSPEFNPQQLLLGGPQYQYDAASAWRTVPEIVRIWSVSTRWEIVRSGSGR